MKDTSGSIFLDSIEGWGASPGPGSEPAPSSGGVFAIEPSDEVATGVQLSLDAIPASTGSPDQTIALTAMAQDPIEGRILAYSLAPGSPAGASINPATGAFTWTVPATEPPGIYATTIDVTDDNSPPLTAVQTFTITVNDVAPTVTLGPASPVALGAKFLDSGTYSSNASGSFTATVDYGDGTDLQPLALGSPKSFRLNHVYARPGTFTVTVNVTDSFGVVGVQTISITVIRRRWFPLVLFQASVPAVTLL